MRSAISEVYEGPRWKRRVAFMPDNQVIAVYKNMVNYGRFKKKKVQKPKFHQISMFEDPNFVTGAP